MKARIESRVFESLRRAIPALASALALASVFALAACSATAPAKKMAPVRQAVAQIQLDDTGFTIAEEVRVADETHRNYAEATRALEQERYAEGIALLLEVTGSAPDVTAPHIDLGIAYGRSGETDKGIASLERALELSPNHPVAYNELGMLQRRQGGFAAARASYERAIALSPRFHFARLNLAILCDLYLADSACALENYVAYQETVPDDKNVAMWITDLRGRAKR